MRRKQSWGYGVLCTLAGALVGCGGGGSSGGSAGVGASLSGLAATGAGIASAAVTAKCASGTPLSGTTDANGSYTLVLDGRSLPCMVQVTGGTPSVTLHSFAQTAGRVNITPVTDLIVAKALGADPATAFTGYVAANGTTIETGLNAAKTYVSTQIGNITGGTIADPLTGAFAVGDADDKVLDALGNAMTAAGKTIAQLRSQAQIDADLTATVPAYLAAPAGLTVSASGSTAVNLAWTGVPGATGYKVFRSTSAGVSTSGEALATVADTAYGDTGLSASSTYYYKVVATNTLLPGGGVVSEEKSATTSAASGGGGGSSGGSGGSAAFTATSANPSSGSGTLLVSSVTVEDAGGTQTGVTNRVSVVGTVNGVFARVKLYYTVATGNVWNVSYAWGGNADLPDNTTFLSCEVSCSGASISGTTLTLSNLQLAGGGTEAATLNGSVTSSAITSGAGSGSGLVAGLNPTHGTVGSTVTIVGSGFGSSPQVKFYDEFLVAGTLIRTEVAASVVSATDTQIVVTVPSGANTGVVKVNATSVGSFTVELLQVGAWTQQESMGGYSVATNGTRFVKVWSLSNVKQSTDGATWNDSFMYSSLNYMGGQVQWDGSQFVYIVSKDATSSPVQTVAVSPDGTNWTTKIAGQKLISWDPQYASSMRDFIAVAGRITLVGDKGGIATSTDGGTNWTLETYPVGYQDHQILAVDDTGTQRIALTLSGDGGAALRSSVAGAWSAVATGLDLKPADLLWTGTTHVATGASTSTNGGARVLRSNDGQTWTAANLPTAYASGTWRGVKLAQQGSTLWLLVHQFTGTTAVGSVLLKSTDNGLNWALDTDFGSDSVSALIFGSSLWMAVGNKTYTRSAP